MPEWLSSGANDFIRRALAKSVDSRATVAELMQHPWILAHTRWVSPGAPCLVGAARLGVCGRHVCGRCP